MLYNSPVINLLRSDGILKFMSNYFLLLNCKVNAFYLSFLLCFLDFSTTLKISDDSYSEFGFSVNFFAVVPTRLPCVRSIGDIISIHQLEVDVVVINIIYDVKSYHIPNFAIFSILLL